jgi:hypothetical protein
MDERLVIQVANTPEQAIQQASPLLLVEGRHGMF